MRHTQGHELEPSITVAAVVENDGRFLMVEEDPRERVFNQPAGRVEAAESLVAAVARETLEETAWHFEAEWLRAYTVALGGQSAHQSALRSPAACLPTSRRAPDAPVIATHCCGARNCAGHADTANADSPALHR